MLDDMSMGVDANHSADEPPLRVMSLHALLYCPRLFYLEEVEEIRVADHAVYAGRELHASLDAGEEGEWSSVELENLMLGLKGRVDCLRRRDGRLIPYEHKRGKPRRDAGEATAWPSDRIQVAAYGMLLEDALGEPVPEARIHYHAENVTVRVSLDECCRADVHSALRLARQLRNATERPPVTDQENRCPRCSLAPVCLPEEARTLCDETHAAIRLFPPNDDRGVLHVITAGASVSRAAHRLVVRLPLHEETPARQGSPRVAEASGESPRGARSSGKRRLRRSAGNGPESASIAPTFTEAPSPIQEIGAVVLHGHAQISTQALHLCVDHGVPVHWLTTGGRYLAGLCIGSGGVHRRLRQYEALRDPNTRLRLTRSLVHARIQGQHRYLLRATRDEAAARNATEVALRAIGQSLALVHTTNDPDSLRGLEGEAAAQYFQSLDRLLRPDVPAELRYGVRTRRPPRDRFNSLLGYGYGLLHTAVMSAILAVGLEPAFGFFHRPRSAAHPLVLDLMELFRVPLWDLVVIGSLNRGQWDPVSDFRAFGPAILLSDTGRRKAINLFESRLEENWKHPVLRYSLSYRRTIELEARLLEKEWSGEPGLFARARLR